MNFMLTLFERSSTFVKSFSNESASLSELIVLKIMWGRHEFINDWNLGRKSNCFWEDSAVRALKNIAPRIPIPGIELGPWRWERQILTTRPHGMSIVQKFSSTSVVALTFRHNDIFQKLCFCVSGESNPGLPRGRREFYHWTTNAIVNVAVPSILCAFQLDFSLV